MGPVISGTKRQQPVIGHEKLPIRHIVAAISRARRHEKTPLVREVNRDGTVRQTYRDTRDCSTLKSPDLRYEFAFAMIF